MEQGTDGTAGRNAGAVVRQRTVDVAEAEAAALAVNAAIAAADAELVAEAAERGHRPRYDVKPHGTGVLAHVECDCDDYRTVSMSEEGARADWLRHASRALAYALHVEAVMRMERRAHELGHRMRIVPAGTTPTSGLVAAECACAQPFRSRPSTEFWAIRSWREHAGRAVAEAFAAERLRGEAA